MNAYRIIFIAFLIGSAVFPAWGQNQSDDDHETDKSVFLLDTPVKSDKSAKPNTTNKPVKDGQKFSSPHAPESNRPSAAKIPPHQNLNQNDVLLQIKFNSVQTQWDLLKEKTQIDAIIEKMQKKPNLRLAIYSYASGKPAKSNQYRRLALDRAWSIADYFHKASIDATRLAIFPIFEPDDPMRTASPANLASDYVALKWLR
ncbi:MAG: hypothetical protein ORN98_00165 [Alphaproteobacteria bacterium]|nr:hypothetical protein [Alphaproteobacteria bacterium]